MSNNNLKSGFSKAKQIESEWFMGTGQRFQAKADKYHKLRKYARGEHSVENSKTLVTNGASEVHTNYDFSPIQILPKFKDKLVNDMMPQLYNIEANAVDQYSTDLKNKERDRLRRRMVSKTLDEDMMNIFGVDMEGIQGDDRPDSEEEIDLRMKMNFKPSAEIMIEEALKYTFKLNDHEEILFELLNDAVDIGRIATREYLHPSKGIIIKRLDPGEMVWSFSRLRNHDDCWYYGLRERVTIGDLQTMTNEVMDMKNPDLPEIKMLSDELFRKSLKGHIHELVRVHDSEESLEPGSMDAEEKLDLLYYNYKAVDEVYYKKKTYKSGATKITPYKGDYDGKETQGFEVIVDKKEVWYEGYLVLGTTYIFGHKLVDNLSYKKESGINRVYPPIRMYATSLYQGEAKGMIERCVTLIDKMQTTEIKIQQLVASTRPSGIRIDVSKINNIKTTGGAIDYKTIMKIYDETGNELYASGDGEENQYSQGNIHELRNGVAQGIMDLVAIQNNYLTQLRDAIGLPQGADASMPHPDTAVRVQEQVIRSSNITISHILDSVLKLTRYTADSTFVRIKDLLKYYPHLKSSYVKAIGQINVDLVEELHKIEKHDIGIFVSLKPSTQSLSQLEQNIQLALSAGSVTADDAQEARDVGKGNTKLANQLLRIRRERREKTLAQREQEKIKLQGEQQVNVAKAQGETEDMKMQSQLIADQSRIQSEAEAKIATIREQGDQDRKTLQFEYNLRTGVEQLKGQVSNQNLSFSENEKMKRRDKDSEDKFALADRKSV